MKQSFVHERSLRVMCTLWRFVFDECDARSAVGIVLEAFHDPPSDALWVWGAMKVDEAVAASMAAPAMAACDAAGVVAPPCFSERNGEVLHGLATPEVIAAGDHAMPKAGGGRVVLFEGGVDRLVVTPSDEGQQWTTCCSICGVCDECCGKRVLRVLRACCSKQCRLLMAQCLCRPVVWRVVESARRCTPLLYRWCCGR